MNFEDDDYCTADYGVFGDQACECSSCKPVLDPYMLKAVLAPDPVRARIIKDRKISADFNSHMIYLFNQNAKRNSR